MLEKIQKIFYRPEFFRRQEFTGGQAFGFYSLSVLFLVVGLSLLLIPGAWGVNRFFESPEWAKQKSIIQGLYPDNLVLTIGNGRLLTNQTAPVIIPFPKEWQQEKQCQKERCKEQDFPANLLVIDREAELSRKAIESHDTLILASETEIGFSHQGRGETRIFSTAEIDFGKRIEVTKASFVYWVERGSSLIQTAILFLMCVLPLLMYVGLWVGYVVYSIFGALVVWLAAHIRDHKLSYGRAYASTLYLLPASFVLMIVMSALGFRVPLLFTLVLFGMALLNFERKPKEESTPGPFSAPKPNNPPVLVTPPRPAGTDDSRNH